LRGSKKKLASSHSRVQRLGMLEWEDSELSLSMQAELLGISRSSLYYRPVGASPAEVAIKHKIDEIYTKYPFYGSRRITVTLRGEGIDISRKRVRRYMLDMGIEAIYPGPNLSKRSLESKIYPYLLRDVTVDRVNQVWGIDITYIRLDGGWMYLVAVIDWYSRYVISWELDQSLEMPFVMRAVGKALLVGVPEIFNSDQGSHFTSDEYTDLLIEKNITISMDGKKRALDNIFTERLWRSVKYEEVYLHNYCSPREARMGISKYVEFYNEQRPHQSLGYQTPGDVYRGNGCVRLPLPKQQECNVQAA
jgi:putative transposase